MQLFHNQHHLGFRGSKIPVRSAKGSVCSSGSSSSNNSCSRGLGVDQFPRPSRWRSLTNLPFEEISCYDLQHPPALPSTTASTSTKLSHRRSNSPSTLSQRLSLELSPKTFNLSNQQLTKIRSRTLLHRQSSSSNSNLSSGSLKSPPSLLESFHSHHNSPSSPRLTRRACESPLDLSHEPYETPQYFTFHLTLRSSAKSPPRQNSRPISRNDTFRGHHLTQASQAATRCVEDMILQTCAVPSQEMLQSVRLPHSIHMPQIPSCEISLDSGCKGDNELEGAVSNTNRRHQEEGDGAECKHHLQTEEDQMNRCKSQNGDSSDQAETDSTQDFFIDEAVDPELIEANVHCLNFGIVDYLNVVMKDTEHDETESICSDCGSGLALTPPTRFSDTDSTIEANPISSDLPLKGFPTPRPSALIRKRPDLKSLKWRSCQELLSKQTKRRLYQRQLSEKSLKVHLAEKNLTGTSDEVYDGNLDASLVTLSKINRSASSAFRRANRHNTSSNTEDNNFKKSSPLSVSSEYQESFKTERHLLHEESRESLEYGCLDSLAVEASDSEFGEHMDLEECSAKLTPPVEQSPDFPKTVPRNSLLSNNNHENSVEFTSVKEKNPSSQNFRIYNKSSGAKKNMTRLSLAKMEQLPDADVDHVLGIQEDDGSGPGLSEDELLATDSPPPKYAHPSPRTVGVISPHKILWYLQTESRRRSNEMSSVRRIQQPPLTDSGRVSEYRQQNSGRDGDSRSLRHVSVSDTSQPTSAISHHRNYPSRFYSDALHGDDSSGEESDTAAELTELERCVLSLNHRRSQLRKQDTNAFLIAPPEYKIEDDVPTVH